MYLSARIVLCHRAVTIATIAHDFGIRHLEVSFLCGARTSFQLKCTIHESSVKISILIYIYILYLSTFD
jgi:hypothetical protein